MKPRELGDICKRVPEKLRTALTTVTGDGLICCVACHKVSDNKGQAMLTRYYLYGCHQVPGRVHVMPVFYCADGDCTYRHGQLLEETGLEAYLGFSVFGDQKSIMRAADEYRLEHRRTGMVCQGCKIPEQKGKARSFKVCGGCKYVRYCSSECQKQNWKSHKTMCLEKRGPSPSKPSPLQVTPVCDCFNAYTRHMHKSIEKGTCSAMECHNAVTGPVTFTFYIRQCTLNGLPHFLPSAYCSSKCHKRNANDPRQHE